MKMEQLNEDAIPLIKPTPSDKFSACGCFTE
jgi:hypothetical protein